MSKTDTQIGFRVTNEFKARLEAQARRERRPVSNLILKVLEDYLDGFAGAVVAFSHDRYFLDNVAEWIAAGAVAVGAGGSLTAGAKTGDYGKITETARQFVEKIRAARGQ